MCGLALITDQLVLFGVAATATATKNIQTRALASIRALALVPRLEPRSARRIAVCTAHSHSFRASTRAPRVELPFAVLASRSPSSSHRALALVLRFDPRSARRIAVCRPRLALAIELAHALAFELAHALALAGRVLRAGLRLVVLASRSPSMYADFVCFEENGKKIKNENTPQPATAGACNFSSKICEI